MRMSLNSRRRDSPPAPTKSMTFGCREPSGREREFFEEEFYVEQSRRAVRAVRTRWPRCVTPDRASDKISFGACSWILLSLYAKIISTATSATVALSRTVFDASRSYVFIGSKVTAESLPVSSTSSYADFQYAYYNRS